MGVSEINQLLSSYDPGKEKVSIDRILECNDQGDEIETLE